MGGARPRNENLLGAPLAIRNETLSRNERHNMMLTLQRRDVRPLPSLRLAVLALVVMLGLVSGGNVIEQGQCIRYNGRLCANYIDYDVFVTAPIEETEDHFARLLAPFTATGSPLAQNLCGEAYAAFVCGLLFKKCGKVDPQTDLSVAFPPCKSNCLAATQTCTALRSPDVLKALPKELQNIAQALPLSNCNGTVGNAMDESMQLSDTFYTDDVSKCVVLQKAQTYTPVCLKPLVVDKSFPNGQDDPEFCEGGCCLPCPQSYAFYKDGQLEAGFLATQIMRAISAIASFIMILSYLALPGKQSHPSILILFTSIAICLYSSNVFFSLGNSKRIQCHNNITPSTQDNNTLCGLQGALLVFSSHATVTWLAVIIFNLHMHTVWNSNILSTKYIYVHCLCWGLPALLTIIPLATRKIRYQFATLCLIDQSFANELFWYPLAVVVVPSFLAHVYTFFYIAKISTETNSDKTMSAVSLSEFMNHRNQVLQAIRIQWRALLLALILLICVIWYWLFYFIELGRITRAFQETDAQANWSTCIQLGRGQDECSVEASNIVPPLGLLIISETVVSLLGMYLLVIFSNRSLWAEWGHWLSEKVRRKRKLDVPDQFFAI